MYALACSQEYFKQYIESIFYHHAASHRTDNTDAAVMSSIQYGSSSQPGFNGPSLVFHVLREK
jgi:hypothetical protein